MKKLGTTCGTWGDIIVNLGYFLNEIKEGKILYLGNNLQIMKFLEIQPFIKDVIRIETDELSWQKYWIYTVFKQTFPDDIHYKITTEAPFIKAGYDPKNFEITHLTFEDTKVDAPIYQWHGVKLPEDVKAWAEEMASKLPNEFYLFQPYSFNSNNPLQHWPDWNYLCGLITARTNKKLVLIGNDWEPRIEELSNKILSNDLISLYNNTPSMLHVFALARHARGIITTSNSLAHWCQIDDLPCSVICNKKSSKQNYIFRRVLNWPTLDVMHYETDVESAFNRISEKVFNKNKFI
jgi:hypothetical protein